MAAATAGRKSVSIYDYPEHLNPFREDDNHNKIRFWTIGRKLNRSNSITFSGIKDFNSWAFQSFRKRKNKKEPPPPAEKTNGHINGDTSPVVFRRAIQYSSIRNGSGARTTVGSPEGADRYVYGGSVTPLPRSRFQERLRATSHNEVNSASDSPRMARSEVLGSRLSVASTNPFEDEPPTAPVRARRKKKRAPPPPTHPAPPTPSAPAAGNDSTISSQDSELQITETDADTNTSKGADTELEDMSFNIELKIVEDEDLTNKPDTPEPKPDASNRLSNNINESSLVVNIEHNGTERTDERDDTKFLNVNENNHKSSSSEEDILDKVSFPKVDIVKYRRNSSINEDEIRLRRGNLEDFQPLSNKRSKSFTNALDGNYLVYDINLNEDKPEKDRNGNDEPQKVVCKLYDDLPRKQSIDTVSSTEKEFIEIDRATRELEREISKLNSALNDDDDVMGGHRLSISEIKRKFDRTDNSPNPIPKPRRSHHGSPVNGNIPT